MTFVWPGNSQRGCRALFFLVRIFPPNQIPPLLHLLHFLNLLPLLHFLPLLPLPILPLLHLLHFLNLLPLFHFLHHFLLHLHHLLLLHLFPLLHFLSPKNIIIIKFPLFRGSVIHIQNLVTLLPSSIFPTYPLLTRNSLNTIFRFS